MEEERTKKLHFGYVVAVGVFILMFPMGFILNAAGIFYTPVSEEFGISQTVFGIHIAITEATMALMLPTVNKLFRKYDTRVTITACMILEGLAYLADSMAKSVWVFYVSGFFLGCCLSLLIYLIIPVLIGNWFVKNTGLWIGICGAAQGISGALFSTVGASIIAAYGWRTCYMVWAGICLVVGIPVSLLMVRYQPSDKGLQPIGYEETNALEETGDGQLSGISVQQALRTSAFYVVAFCPLCIAFACNMNLYFNSYYLSLGMTTVMAGTAASAVMIGNMTGKLLVGAVADRNLKAAVMVAGSGIIAMPLFILVAPRILIASWIAAFLFGISFGSCNTLGPILVRNIFGNRDFGAIWSQATRLQAISVTIASVVWGVIVGHMGYSGGMWISFALFAIAVILGLRSISNAEKIRSQWTLEEKEVS
ncbi:MAG: MFS transporter [Lachnospiraceae bacterium]|nr:MFS transporter [Lachnospiraceae bacterium]